jgi:hypothetical protein
MLVFSVKMVVPRYKMFFITCFCCLQICISLRLLASEENFPRGPFHLGRWSKLVAGIALVWACIAIIMFVLPQVYPVTAAVSASHLGICML